MDEHHLDCGPDMAVRPELQPSSGQYIGTAFGIPKPQSKAVQKCINACVLSLLLAVDQGYSGVRYSRNRNHYHGKSVDLPNYWTLKNVGEAASHLEAATDYFIHCRQPPQVPHANR